jgi:hypothetical protein
MRSFVSKHASVVIFTLIDLNSTNQTMSVYEQLRAGCRFLDIRVDWRHNKWVIVHGPVTAGISLHQSVQSAVCECI